MLLLVASSAILAFSGPGHFASTSSTRAPAVTLYGAMAKKWESSHEGESFVGTEMRGAAMALHTKGQAPKEGKAPERKQEQSPPQSQRAARQEQTGQNAQKEQTNKNCPKGRPRELQARCAKDMSHKL